MGGVAPDKIVIPLLNIKMNMAISPKRINRTRCHFNRQGVEARVRTSAKVGSPFFLIRRPGRATSGLGKALRSTGLTPGALWMDPTSQGTSGTTKSMTFEHSPGWSRVGQGRAGVPAR